MRAQACAWLGAGSRPGAPAAAATAHKEADKEAREIQKQAEKLQEQARKIQEKRNPRVTYPGMSRVGHNMIPGPHTRGNIPSFIGASAWEGQCYVISRGRCMEGAVFCHFH